MVATTTRRSDTTIQIAIGRAELKTVRAKLGPKVNLGNGMKVNGDPICEIVLHVTPTTQTALLMGRIGQLLEVTLESNQPMFSGFDGFDD